MDKEIIDGVSVFHAKHCITFRRWKKNTLIDLTFYKRGSSGWMFKTPRSLTTNTSITKTTRHTADGFILTGNFQNFDEMLEYAKRTFKMVYRLGDIK